MTNIDSNIRSLLKTYVIYFISFFKINERTCRGTPYRFGTLKLWLFPKMYWLTTIILAVVQRSATLPMKDWDFRALQNETRMRASVLNMAGHSRDWGCGVCCVCSNERGVYISTLPHARCVRAEQMMESQATHSPSLPLTPKSINLHTWPWRQRQGKGKGKKGRDSSQNPKPSNLVVMVK